MTAICVDDLLKRIQTLESELAIYKGEVLPKVVVNEGQFWKPQISVFKAEEEAESFWRKNITPE